MNSEQMDSNEGEWVQRAIEAAPDILAQRFGLDVARIQPILQRIVRNQADILLCVNLLKITNPEGVLDIAFHPSLKRALEHLPSNEALVLFEGNEQDRLRASESLVDWLTHPYSQVYSLSDLVELTSQFILFLEGVSEQVIATGYAMATFAPSYWLDSNLSNLYFTSTLSEYRAITNWKSAVGRDLSTFDDFEIIPSDEALQLAEMRPRLSDMKVAVLRELLSSARRRNAEGMWDRCLRILTDTITAEEADFLLAADDYYEWPGLSAGKLEQPSAKRRRYMASSGGLTQILLVIGHFEEELTTGRMYSLYDAIGDAINPPSDRYPYNADSPGNRLNSLNYYAAIAQKGRDAVDKALAAYLASEEQARAYRNDYKRRVNWALENELYEDIVVRKKVRRKFAHKFEPHIRHFADLVSASLECTGEIPPVRYDEPVARAEKMTNAFQKTGDMWTIVYDGKETHVRDSKGMRYIALLMANPGKEHHVLDMVHTVEGSVSPATDSPYRRMSEEELQDLELTKGGLGDAGDVLSPETKAEYERIYDEAKRNLAKAERTGDIVLGAEAKKKIEFVASALKKGLGLGGRSRKVSSASERARVSIRKSIDTALKNIEQADHQLGIHFRNAFKTGTFCSYTPDQKIHWDL